ncbi:ABC transporter ATP-binding protein [Nocardioides sp. Kera G14]|uniref:ABC transporter ATP-binding protein n=1 Tax=Nocardioides sp. Kera G14 TaxID=2884264 RepID=UPI001D11E1BC|nr:ABC transporter ATP-binding protein [Nocardioides sp. Kera G14]UDY23023.1 ABC transporter ATP-binding protein [Nocardioides sp. Kera G14]
MSDTVAAGVADLVLDGVGHTYRSRGAEPVHALTETSLTIGAGSFVALVGPSGCGKSTLLEILAGLRPPSHGCVLLGDAVVVGPGRRRGVVFQQSSSLLPWRSVARNVELGVELQGLPRAQRREIVARELARVGLSDFAGRQVYELSGGMQQRTQIARALAADPEVLLLDEPFGALDTFTRERLQEELRTIWKQTGKTVVLVTHSVEEAALLATRVLVMSPRPGRVIDDHAIDFTRRDASAAELRADPDFVAFAARVRSSIGVDAGSS